MDRQNTTLDDISGVIGFTPTLKLSAWYGATNNLYVPESAADSPVLVRLLGEDLAQRLCVAFPREFLAIPRLSTYDDESLRYRIATLLMTGLSTRQVSKFEQISERRVQQICRELEREGVIEPIGPQKLSGKEVEFVRKRVRRNDVEKALAKNAVGNSVARKV